MLRIASVLLAAAWLGLAPPSAASAQEGSDGTIHWAFSSFLGTGVYRITGERTAFILHIPGRFTLSRSKIGQDGERRVGVEVRLPLTLGIMQADTLGDFIDQESYGTVAFSPGVEVEIPVTRDWLLRPYVYFGGGWELGDADDNTSVVASALIYQTGLKSRYHLPIEVGNWGLLGAVQYAGYNPDAGASSDLLIVMGGLETRQRLGSLMNGNHALFIEGHATYSYVTDLAKLRNGANPPVGIDDFWEVGLGISQGVVPFRILRFIPIERFGVAFQLSTDTRYRAVKLSFRSPFRR